MDQLVGSGVPCYVSFLLLTRPSSAACNSSAKRMNEGVELISEWPVKDSSCENDDSTGLGSPTLERLQQLLPQRRIRRSNPSSFIGGPGKRQHQESASWSVAAGKDCSIHKREIDHEQCASPFLQQCSERGEPRLDSASDHSGCLSEVVVKAPRFTCSDMDHMTAVSHKVKEHPRDSQALCGSSSDCGTAGCTYFNNEAEAGISNTSVQNVSAEQCKTKSHGSRESSTEAVGHQASTDKCLSADNSRSAELLAQPRVARWWRRHGRHLVGFEQRGKTLDLPQSSNPNTLLFHVARLPEGQAFLKEERWQLKKRLEQREASGDVMAALGSIEECLGNLEEAVQYLKCSLEIEPHNKEWQWLLHKTQRQVRMKQRQAELLSTVSLQPVFPQSQQVERVSCRDLSFAEFFHKYAQGRKPVIITDMVETMTTVPWDLQHIREVAGDCEATVKQSVPGSVEWARLEQSKSVKVAQFLNSLHCSQDYLFDWSLPLHCPGLAEELTIPCYFAGDFLQRSSPGSLYQDSWPSLFIAPPGVHSGLHIDAFASNFWMALFKGKKRWIFFQEEDVPCLYPVYAHSLDPTFEVKVTDPEIEVHPLLSLVHPMECILNAGEILFVPGGCPHYVQNLTTTLAISANFVDLSNFHRVLEELQVNSLLDPRAADLAQQFRQPSFLSAMRRDMGDLPWADFKTWPPTDVEKYCLTEEGDSVR